MSAPFTLSAPHRLERGSLRHVHVPARDHEKHYLTSRMRDAPTVGDAIGRYVEMLEQHAGRDTTVVYEKVFGRLAAREELLAARRAWYRQAERSMPPISFIEGLPDEGGPIAGAISYGVTAPREGAVAVRHLPDAATGAPRATVVETPRMRALHLCEVTDAGDPAEGTVDRCRGAFERVDRALRLHGFAPSDIVRTWIYLSDIARDYVALNDARRRFLAAHGIDFGAASNDLPASTCIEGRSDERRVISMDVYCVQRATSRGRSRRVYNTLQSEADGSSYPMKPSFSRAMLLEDGEHRELQLSGTASIDATGATVFAGHAAEQIRQTLWNVKHLLEAQGFRAEDVCQATYHFKSEAVLREFAEVSAAMGFGPVLGPCIVTNICRPDLLFEVDGVALTRSPASSDDPSHAS